MYCIAKTMIHHLLRMTAELVNIVSSYFFSGSGTATKHEIQVKMLHGCTFIANLCTKTQKLTMH